MFPTPEALSRADPQALKALGMPLRRAEALIHLARAALSGELPLTAPADIDAGLRQLQTLPGIGRWTANYFALRGWQAKDIFLPDDYLIKQRFPGMTRPPSPAMPAAGSRCDPTRCCISGIPMTGRRRRNSRRGAYHWYRDAEIPIIAAFGGPPPPSISIQVNQVAKIYD